MPSSSSVSKYLFFNPYMHLFLCKCISLQTIFRHNSWIAIIDKTLGTNRLFLDMVCAKEREREGESVCVWVRTHCNAFFSPICTVAPGEGHFWRGPMPGEERAGESNIWSQQRMFLPVRVHRYSCALRGWNTQSEQYNNHNNWCGNINLQKLMENLCDFQVKSAFEKFIFIHWYYL